MYYHKTSQNPYVEHLENIRYHIYRARKEMQKEKDRWFIDVKILYSLEDTLTDLIKKHSEEDK